jgi:two-component system, NarL family, sensor histidine kinase DesK
LVTPVADDRADRLVRLATVGVVAWNAALAARFGYQFALNGQLNLVDGLAWLAYLPMSSLLVLRGIRGAAGWTSWLLLAASATVVAGVLPLSGPLWPVTLAPLAGFGLIFIRWPWSLLGFAAALAVAFADSLTVPIPRIFVGWHYLREQFATYDALIIVWTGIALAVLIGLAGILRDLQAARQQLALRALIAERQRIDDELAQTIGAALRLIIEDSQHAGRLTRLDPQAAARRLGDVTSQSRTALADARQMLTGYRSMSLGAELRAATTLLAAAGVHASVELPDAELPEELPGPLRSRLRAAVAQALSDGLTGQCVLAVSRDEDGGLDARIVVKLPVTDGATQ